MPLFNCTAPANVEVMTQELVTLANLDYIPMDAADYVDLFFVFPSIEDPYGSNFDGAGYGGIYHIDNSPADLFQLKVAVLIYILFFILYLLTRNSQPENKLPRFTKYIRNSFELFYIAPIRFAFENFLEFGIVVFISFATW